MGNLLSIGDEAISNTPIELSATPAKYANLILTWTKFDLAHLHISTAICFPSNSEISGHLLLKGWPRMLTDYQHLILQSLCDLRH